MGIGLYMIPADLALNVGVLHRYNTNLVTADENTELGENEDINRKTITTTVNAKSVHADEKLHKSAHQQHAKARRSQEVVGHSLA